MSGTHRFLYLRILPPDVGYEKGVRGSPNGIFQAMCEFGLAEGNVFPVLLSQSYDSLLQECQ